MKRKFKVGDKYWIIMRSILRGDSYVSDVPEKLQTNSNKHLLNFSNARNIILLVSKDDVYETKELAQQECERRNKLWREYLL